jgi:uncharacterized protein YndB with AHSA1/START domain
MDEFVVKKSIRLNATPGEVWDALTNPKKTKKYFFNCAAYSDWREGSPITFRGKLFFVKKIEMHGTIIKAEPGKILKYTLKNSGSMSVSTVTDRLSYGDGQTILSVSDDVGNDEDSEKRYKRSVKGWNKVLKGLKKLVESN